MNLPLVSAEVSPSEAFFPLVAFFGVFFGAFLALGCETGLPLAFLFFCLVSIVVEGEENRDKLKYN